MVIDHSTNLIWHQSGSTVFVALERIKQYIEEVNESKYAGGELRYQHTAHLQKRERSGLRHL